VNRREPPPWPLTFLPLCSLTFDSSRVLSQSLTLSGASDKLKSSQTKKIQPLGKRQGVCG
ncbi:Beta-galactosidase, partial [Dissostichus eleginoides]